MRVLHESLAPGVKHAQHADHGAEMFRISRDLAERGGARAEQQVIHDLLILERQPRELMRYREDHMRILTREEFGLPFGEPRLTGAGQTLRAMPVAARNGVHSVTCEMGSPR